ncbi:hypothetical protein [uncultured Croceitalea sp.]|uniref:hypothetical protein n=1 Tax=uncultured Croceitalea sp. TaxID=1798908 RepID=UPI0033060969
MPNQEITTKDLATYMYIMAKIFPEDYDVDDLLTRKKNLEHFYIDNFNNETKKLKSFRKTITRNYNTIRDIRNGSIKKRYYPNKRTLEIFLGFLYGNPSDVSYVDYVKDHTEEIDVFFEKSKPTDEVLHLFIPKLPEKLEGIENRILKIEEFIASKDNLIEDLLKRNSKLKSFEENYGNQKMGLDFLNYLQKQLNETKREYKWAKQVYRNMGSFGLFFIPLKYAFFDEEDLLEDFLEETYTFNDDGFLDDLA